ncbi:hypothetical protein E3N88_07540 [Mikania micrantha]|uniref:Uncharacterized protein n=1 Tax=Mikania micrantha TaxID=192012 RepID=A0A5N6PRU0_9ASTR|nr:hypothetical protein E3N88_07540 [Mikania micrantha]
MSGREVREYTNLSDPKDKKLGRGKDRIDDEDITFQRMVAKMQEVAGDRGGYLHGRGALDSDDLLYLKEQMEAEEDAERLLPANLADSSPATVPLPLRVEPKTKTGIRQQDLLKKVVEVKPKRHKVSTQTTDNVSTENKVQVKTEDKNQPIIQTNPIKSLLAAYEIGSRCFVPGIGANLHLERGPDVPQRLLAQVQDLNLVSGLTGEIPCRSFILAKSKNLSDDVPKVVELSCPTYFSSFPETCRKSSVNYEVVAYGSAQMRVQVRGPRGSQPRFVRSLGFGWHEVRLKKGSAKDGRFAWQGFGHPFIQHKQGSARTKARNLAWLRFSRGSRFTDLMVRWYPRFGLPVRFAGMCLPRLQQFIIIIPTKF